MVPSSLDQDILVMPSIVWQYLDKGKLTITSVTYDVSALLSETQAALGALKVVTEKASDMEEGEEQARFYHFEVVPAMDALRAPVDKLEMIVDKDLWPMPSYGDLIFEV